MSRGKRHIRKKLYKLSNVCAGCGGQFEFSDMTVDHIIPRSRGGKGLTDNYQLMCWECNEVKDDRSMDEFMASSIRPGQPDYTCVSDARKAYVRELMLNVNCATDENLAS